MGSKREKKMIGGFGGINVKSSNHVEMHVYLRNHVGICVLI